MVRHSVVAALVLLATRAYAQLAPTIPQLYMDRAAMGYWDNYGPTFRPNDDPPPSPVGTNDWTHDARFEPMIYVRGDPSFGCAQPEDCARTAAQTVHDRLAASPGRLDPGRVVLLLPQSSGGSRWPFFQPGRRLHSAIHSSGMEIWRHNYSGTRKGIDHAVSWARDAR